jgi:hypothetical protein
MRCFFFIAIVVLAAMGSISDASARGKQRYCLQGSRWGFPGNCQFSTLQQCRATASGTASSCGMNPRYAAPRQ